MTDATSPGGARVFLPLFMVGAATAVAAETALGLLVYTSPGLLQAITVVVGVELAALLAGLATAPPAGVRGGRWRWFVATGAFAIAGFASIAWTLDTDFMATWTTRGLSLAVLAGLPMYGCGLLFSAIPARADGHRHGVPIVLGALVGVVLIGIVLFDRLQPFGIWLFGVFCISVAAFLTAVDVTTEARDAVQRARAEAARDAADAAERARAAALESMYGFDADDVADFATPTELASADPDPAPGSNPDPEVRPA